MKILDDLITESVDRIVEKKVGDKIEQSINSIIDTAIRKEIEAKFRDKIVKAVEDSSKNVDAILKDIKSVDSSVQTYLKKYQAEILAKLQAAMEKVTIQVDLSAIQGTINTNVSKAFLNVLSYNSEKFGKIIAQKALDYVTKATIFPTKE